MVSQGKAPEIDFELVVALGKNFGKAGKADNLAVLVTGLKALSMLPQSESGPNAQTALVANMLKVLDGAYISDSTTDMLRAESEIKRLIGFSESKFMDAFKGNSSSLNDDLKKMGIKDGILGVERHLNSQNFDPAKTYAQAQKMANRIKSPGNGPSRDQLPNPKNNPS